MRRNTLRFLHFIKRRNRDSNRKHIEAPHLRLLQKRLAEEITVMVHSTEDLENAIKASNILFGNSTSDDLKELDEATFLEVLMVFPS
jgi:tyrosyl-tRNA synthetase